MTHDYNRLAEFFVGDDRVLIAQVNGDNNYHLLRSHATCGYPTLKFFPRGTNTVEDARCGRDFESMKAFIEEVLKEQP